MADITPADILYIGHGAGPVSWYRCFQPAIALEADWVGTVGEPPHNLHNVCGQINGEHPTEDLVATDYKVIIVQLVRGPRWREWILQAQRAGVVVLYEIDDDVFSAGYMKDHPNASLLRAEADNYRMCLKQCDGIICSTPHLAYRLKDFNRKTWVCPVGIDTVRYRPSDHKRDPSVVTIGFAGGLGHERSLDSWLPAIQAATKRFDNVRFVSIGNDSADKIDGEVQPAVHIQDYPAAMAQFDISLAPGGTSDFYRCKGELKWTEAGALAIPTIASPIPSISITHGVTGFHVKDVSGVRHWLDALIRNAELRHRVGWSAYEWVHENYTIQRQSENWIKVFEEVVP